MLKRMYNGGKSHERGQSRGESKGEETDREKRATRKTVTRGVGKAATSSLRVFSNVTKVLMLSTASLLFFPPFLLVFEASCVSWMDSTFSKMPLSFSVRSSFRVAPSSRSLWKGVAHVSRWMGRQRKTRCRGVQKRGECVRGQGNGRAKKQEIGCEGRTGRPIPLTLAIAFKVAKKLGRHGDVLSENYSLSFYF